MKLVLHDTDDKKKCVYRNPNNNRSKKYHLIPISTDRKGPIYTIVDDDFIQMYKKSSTEIKMVFEIDFGTYDTYRNKPAHIYVPVSKGLSHYANLMPLVFQIFVMGDWLQISDSIHCVDVMNVDISVNDRIFKINLGDSLKEPRKSFKKLGLDTHCKTIFGTRLEWAEGCCPVIILKDSNIWRYCSIEEACFEVFEYIIIPIGGAESVYLLTFREFQLFSMIDNMCVGTSIGGFSGIEAGYGMFSNNIVEVLESCLFFPQLLLMLDEIYGYKYGWEVKFSLNDAPSEYYLSVEPDIIQKNQCRDTSLFYTLKKFMCYLRDIKDE